MLVGLLRCGTSIGVSLQCGEADEHFLATRAAVCTHDWLLLAVEVVQRKTDTDLIQNGYGKFDCVSSAAAFEHGRNYNRCEG